MRVYVDSDILIWHLRGERRAATLLRRLARAADAELWTGAMQRAEVVFFMRPHEEAATVSFLSRLHTQPVTKAIVDRAGALYRRWHPSHGSGVNDALLAATAESTGGKIVTQNVKHYPMPDVVVQKGW
jgi:predicted nucleic acid-binding protein